jgi:hypothetical protein
MENQNNTLKLVLTHKWYDMIESGEKTEEYRDITPYWVRRLVKYFSNYSHLINQPHLYLSGRFDVEFKPYTHVQFQRAYPKNPPRMTKAIKSIRIGTGKPELGAIENKLYFVIELE